MSGYPRARRRPRCIAPGLLGGPRGSILRAASNQASGRRAVGLVPSNASGAVFPVAAAAVTSFPEPRPGIAESAALLLLRRYGDHWQIEEDEHPLPASSSRC